MIELFPYLSARKARRLDRKIKALIASDDRDECTLTHVRKVLTPVKENKYTFNPNCEKLAKCYFENNKKIVCQENLFCLFGLIASIILLLMEIILDKYPCEWLEKIFEPLIIYPCAFIAFLIMVRNGWAYKKTKFNDYLNLLSRNSTSLPFVSSACFCIFLSADLDNCLRLSALLLCALMPCCTFIKSYCQLKVKDQY